MADLPPEIITGIISLLPVQSLLRFRSTSKSLQSLIDSHNFIKLHLRNSLNRFLILRHNSDFYQINDFSNLTTRIKLNLPFKIPNNFISLFGSCNGLLCISINVGIAFWNPNIRKHRIIPNLPIQTPALSKPNTIHVGFCVHGFGFDPLTDDYKLSESLVSSNYTTTLMIHMLHSSARKRTPGKYFLNSLHWIMKKKLDGLQSCLIIAFNLKLEIFNEVPLPEIGYEVNVESFKIDVLESLRPLGYSSDGSMVLFEVDHEKLFWYDLKSEHVNYVEGIPNLNEAMICVGSLVPPSFPRNENRTSKRRYFLLIV
ncbi:ubiquitin-protein ligase, putative [Medicago truncatula]|uniref:Ubiquitin-protein ligase, putative n=1 Tax=Medicago truncatula TaxID=3880 RepID=G7ZZK2_MEDTR|nr:ubiquitin-protein ligase, putative [Medicago truncatula]